MASVSLTVPNLRRGHISKRDAADDTADDVATTSSECGIELFGARTLMEIATEAKLCAVEFGLGSPSSRCVADRAMHIFPATQSPEALVCLTAKTALVYFYGRIPAASHRLSANGTCNVDGRCDVLAGPIAVLLAQVRTGALVYSAPASISHCTACSAVDVLSATMVPTSETSFVAFYLAS